MFQRVRDFMLDLVPISVFLLMLISGFVRVEPSPYEFLSFILVVITFLLGIWKFSKETRFLLISLFVFLISQFVSLFFIKPVNLSPLFFYSLKTFYLVVTWAFFVVFLKYYKDRGLKSIWFGYVFGALVASILGILGMIHVPWFSKLFVYSGSRAFGFFKDPNVYSAFLVPPAIFIFYHFMTQKRNSSFVYGLSFLVLQLGIFLALSRGAWLNAFVAFVIYLVWIFKEKILNFRKLLAIFFFSIATDFGFALLTHLPFWSKLGFLPYDEKRFSTMIIGAQSALRNPFGIGAGQFESTFNNYASHNLFIRVFTENGWIGFIAFSAFIVISIIKCLRNIKGLELKSRNYAVTLLSSVGGLLINSFFIDSLHWRHFWLIMALLLFVPQNNSEKKKSNNNILFLATVDSHIYYFHIPFMKLLKEMGYCVEVAASNVGFTEKIEKEGFKVNTIPFSRNPLSFSNVKSFFILYRLIKKEKYIMIHTHTPVASFIGRIAAKLAGVPHIVYTAHGFHFHEHGSKFKNFVYFILEKFAGKFTDVLITINTDDYRVALDKKIVSHGKVFYVKGVGVDLERFNLDKFDLNFTQDYRKSLGFKESDFVFITIAELTRDKNLTDLIEAFSMITRDLRNTKLLIVGDGVLFKRISGLVAKKNLQDRTFLLGRRNDIPELLSISNGFVLTSIREGLPRSVMEAMSMERTIVAYNIRGVRDLVEDGVNGFLVPFGDVKALSEKIKYLLKHPGIAEEMGKKGRERIEKEFSFDAILLQMEKLYKEILESEYN